MKATDADIRRWARSQGIPVGERGRVQDKIRDAYYETHPEARP
jgi:hypothetical protein